MKWWFRDYCPNCDIHMKDEYWTWVADKYAHRCKCPNCNKLIQRKNVGMYEGNRIELSVIHEIVKCRFCDRHTKDNLVLKYGCTHFIEDHPDILYKMKYFEPTGRYAERSNMVML